MTEKGLILAGIFLIALGIFWTDFPRIGWLDYWNKLPGDIVVERENFTLYIPLTTSILISVALSLFHWILQKI